MEQALSNYSPHTLIHYAEPNENWSEGAKHNVMGRFETLPVRDDHTDNDASWSLDPLMKS